MKFTSKITLAVLGAIVFSGCTKLNEETFSSLLPDTYYKSEADAISSVAGIYQSLAQVASVSAPWTISVEGSDEFIVPGRASGGWFDQNNFDIMLHNVAPTNTQITNAWLNIFSEIGISNSVIASLTNSSLSATFKTEIAEARALRAYGYFYAMDFYGNVPLVTTPKIEQSNLPPTTARADIFKFVETEWLAAAADLPSVTTVDKTKYYPRLTKEAVYMALATLYLNAEVYSGTQRWADAAKMCDNVTASGAYALEANVVDCFKAPTKGTTKEVIFAFSLDPTRSSGGNPFILYTQPALDQQRYSLNFAPANGFSTFQVALDRYENQDNRKKLIEYGPQYYANGQPLVDSKGVQLNLVNVVSYTAALDNEGYRVLKYVPDGAVYVGGNGNNDLVLTRYSDVLLTKAEALFRQGNAAGALPLVNQVRARSNASALAVVTLQDIENERAREFIYEGHRRRDMIRFGSFFTGTWQFKTTVDQPFRGLYPIPATQLALNPKLKQNPGY